VATVSDLEELLGRAWRAREDAERAAAGTGLPDPLPGLAQRVRGRRVRRHVLQGVAAVPVAAGLALGGWALTGRVPAPAPVVTQTSTPAPTPSSSAPTPSPTSTPTQAAPVPLPSEPGLPDRLAAPADLLDRVGPGWVLEVYTTARPDDGSAPAATVVLLAAPDGSLYELRRLSLATDGPAGSWLNSMLVDWDAASGTALIGQDVVTPDPGDPYNATSGPTSIVSLDLRTGALSPVPGSEGLDVASYVGPVADGRLWTGGQDDPSRLTVLHTDGTRSDIGVPTKDWILRSLVSPDGTRVLADGYLVELRTGSSSPVPGLGRTDDCSPLAWWTASTLLASCEDPAPADRVVPWLERHPRLVEVALDGTMTVLRAATAADPAFPLPKGWASAGTRLGDKRVVALGAAPESDGPIACDGQGTMLEIAGDGATLTPVPTADARGLSSVGAEVSGRYLAYSSSPSGGCSDWAIAGTTTLVDLEAGTAQLAVPLPPDQRPDGGQLWGGDRGFAIWR
jgi:hypothetical protein